MVGIATGVVLSRLFRGPWSSPDESRDEATSLPVNATLMKAIHFSAQKHKDQRRKHARQTPYICHPVSVAHRLAIDAGVSDMTVLIAALLHDTVEDTETTLDEIEKLFGLEVAKVVDEVTDDKSLPKEMRKQLQIDHAPHVSQKAKLVKLADKLDNLSDLLIDPPVGWSGDRVAEYFSWAEKVIAGLRGTSSALEAQLDEVLGKRQLATDVAFQAGRT